MSTTAEDRSPGQVLCSSSGTQQLIEGFLASTRLDFSPFCNPTMKHRVCELLGYDVR